MKHAHVVALSYLSMLVFLPPTAEAQNPFRAEVNLKLCPEYGLSGTAVALTYTTPGSIQKITPPIIEQSIDATTKTGRFVVELPSNFGPLPLRVSSTCTNARGLGQPSNVVEISYCDALQLRDTDEDSLSDRIEDANCNNSFDFGDTSHFALVDSDNDGLSDPDEKSAQTFAWHFAQNRGPKLIPTITLDRDVDGDSDLVAFRPTSGRWFFKDTAVTTEIDFGSQNGVPFLYQVNGGTARPAEATIDGEGITWHFSGPGTRDIHENERQALRFGLFGDVLLPGQWLRSGTTTPAVARFTDTGWKFTVYQSEGEEIETAFTGKGTPYPLDRSGTGTLEPAVLDLQHGTLTVRDSGTQTTFPVSLPQSSTPVFAQDIDRDGKSDVIVWDAASKTFHYAMSSMSYTIVETAMFVGAPSDALPLGPVVREGVPVLTIFSPSTGMRYYFTANDDSTLLKSEQWGTQEDILG